jgi:TatD DNase family protein
VGEKNKLCFVDAHCHLNFEEFDNDRFQVIERAQENGIERIVIPGIDIQTSKSAIKCASDFPQIYAAVGVHPNSGRSWTMNSITEIRQLAAEGKVVAIGEIGLDYYRDYTPRELQNSIFIEQLELAAELDLPVIVHNREASEDIAEILSKWQISLLSIGTKLAEHPGVLHSFSGTLEFADKMVAHNYSLGIGGPLTFRNSQNLPAIIRTFPLDCILTETDAPYLSPDPYRGTRNEPANVRIVAEKIAEVKSISIEEVSRSTTEAAARLFNWRKIN